MHRDHNFRLEFDEAELARYQGPDIKPGDLMTIKIGDKLYTDVVYSIGPSYPPTLSRWQRIKRRLTPRRWRKPLVPHSPGIAIRCEGDR